MFALCDKMVAKNKFKPHRKLFGGYTFSAFEDINLIPKEEWDLAIKDYNTFLSFSYLSLIHQQVTDNFRFRYVIVYHGTKPMGVIYFQINDFSASLFGELIAHQISELQSKRASVFQKYIQHNEHETIMRLVTCGNNFISGEHGFYIDIASKKK